MFLICNVTPAIVHVLRVSVIVFYKQKVFLFDLLLLSSVIAEIT